MNWNDFNQAEDHIHLDLLPKGTLVKVRMNIKAGGYNDPQRGWTGGYATRNLFTGSIYLNTEYTILEGFYAHRKIWGRIGLYSEKSEEWAKMGRSFIKGILNSARGLSYKDTSLSARNARTIQGLGDLEGIEFVGLIDVEIDQNGKDKNIIKQAITSDHKDYATLMGPGNTRHSFKNVAQPSSLLTRLPSWVPHRDVSQDAEKQIHRDVSQDAEKQIHRDVSQDGLNSTPQKPHVDVRPRS